jgi:hypothetical protein
MADYFKNVNEIEELNVKLSQEHLSEDLQKYELSVNVLAQTLNEIHLSFKDRELTPEKKIVTVMLAYRFLIASKCLFKIATSGYYYESFVLLRSMEENVIYCLSFEVSNDCAKKWFTKDGLKLKEAKEAIKGSSRNLSYKGYNYLCDYVHSNKPAIARFQKLRENRGIEIPTGPDFTKEGYRLFRAFRALNMSLLSVLVDVFIDDLEKKAKNTITTFVSEEQKEMQNKS